MEPWGSHPSQHSRTAELRASKRSMTKDEGTEETDGEAVRVFVLQSYQPELDPQNS